MRCRLLVHATLTLLWHQRVDPDLEGSTTVLDYLTAYIVYFKLAFDRTRTLVNRCLLNRNEWRYFVLSLTPLTIMMQMSLLRLGAAASSTSVSRGHYYGRCLERVRYRARIADCLLVLMVVMLLVEGLVVIAEHFALEAELDVLVMSACWVACGSP